MKIIKGKLTLTLLVFMFWSSILNASDNFKLIQKVTFDDEVYGYFRDAIIDKDNDLICSFYRTPLRMFTKEKSMTFATRGQGPNQLTDLWTYCLYQSDLALFEMPNKIKIFAKKNGAYVWKETKWLKSGPYVHTPRDAIFFDDKWFVAGANYHDLGGKGSKISFIKIYAADGNPLKDLIFKESSGDTQYLHMDFFVLDCNGNVLYLPENELKVTVIDPKELKIIREAALETPSSYKPMPPDFYVPKRSDNPGDIMKMLEKWRFSYSRILSIAVDNGHLVLQYRVFDDKLKKFALLFYDTGSFKLEKTIFTNDCFMTARTGKYYFYANGDPGIDEEADKCVINVYSFEDK